MITTKFYLDTRAVAKDAPAPLRLVITKNGVRSLISLNVSVLSTQWDNVRQTICNHPQKRFLNSYIQERKVSVDQILFRMTSSGEITGLTSTQIKNKVVEELYPDDAPQRVSTFIDCFVEFTNTKTGRTKEIYSATLTAIRKFIGAEACLTFSDVSADWLSRFDKFLAQTSPARNARNIHLRNIRAVFNYAIDNERTTLYPFRKYRIKNEATAKRALTVKQLRTLFNMDVEPHMEKYRDMFKLVFLLIGINMVDLSRLQSVTGDRIVYHRAKTNRLYSIRVEPEAMEIINKYRGQDCLVDICDHCEDYKDYLKRMNMNLQRIGSFERVGNKGKKVYKALFPGLTTYWARHSWATIAADLDIPKETIAAALGHGGNTVTDIYINFDQRKVDEANRRVIDWVLYEKR